MCSEEKTKGVSGKRFAEWIRRVLPGSSQPSPQRPGRERELSRKDLWRALLSNGTDPHDIHRRPTRFLGMLSQQKCCSWTEGDKEAEANRAVAGPEDRALSNRGLFSGLKT